MTIQEMCKTYGCVRKRYEEVDAEFIVANAKLEQLNAEKRALFDEEEAFLNARAEELLKIAEVSVEESPRTVCYKPHSSHTCNCEPVSYTVYDQTLTVIVPGYFKIVEKNSGYSPKWSNYLKRLLKSRLRTFLLDNGKQ